MSRLRTEDLSSTPFPPTEELVSPSLTPTAQAEIGRLLPSTPALADTNAPKRDWQWLAAFTPALQLPIAVDKAAWEGMQERYANFLLLLIAVCVIAGLYFSLERLVDVVQETILAKEAYSKTKESLATLNSNLKSTQPMLEEWLKLLEVCHISADTSIDKWRNDISQLRIDTYTVQIQVEDMGASLSAIFVPDAAKIRQQLIKVQAKISLIQRELDKLLLHAIPALKKHQQIETTRQRLADFRAHLFETHSPIEIASEPLLASLEAMLTEATNTSRSGETLVADAACSAIASRLDQLHTFGEEARRWRAAALTYFKADDSENVEDLIFEHPMNMDYNHAIRLCSEGKIDEAQAILHDLSTELKRLVERDYPGELATTITQLLEER